MQAVRFQFVINGDRLRDVPEYQQAKQLRIFGQCTVKELVQDYINSKPTIHPSNLTMLRQFMRDPLTSKTVLELTRQDVNRFKERRLNDTWKPPGSTGEPKQISPRTVRRHMNIIAMVFHHAINFKDGFAALPNHFLGHTVKGGKGGKRDRTLEDGEEARLMGGMQQMSRAQQLLCAAGDLPCHLYCDAPRRDYESDVGRHRYRQPAHQNP